MPVAANIAEPDFQTWKSAIYKWTSGSRKVEDSMRKTDADFHFIIVRSSKLDAHSHSIGA